MMSKIFSCSATSRPCLGNTGPVVRRAFASYDLTFLTHAAAEQERSMLDLWLEQVGLTTDAVMNAKSGRRP